MKRALSLLLVVCMLAGMLVTSAFAVGETTITVGTVTAQPGQSVTVPVTISNNPGFAGFTFDVKYDTEHLTLTKIGKGSLLKDSESGALVPNPEGNRMTWYDPYNLDGDGQLLILTFTVKDSAAGDYEINLEKTGGQPTNFVRVNDEGKVVAADVTFVAGKISVPVEHTHTWGEWTQTKAPTCTEKGTETRTCSGCKETETREVAALGHDYQITAETDTEVTYTCTRCQDSYTKPKAAAAIVVSEAYGRTGDTVDVTLSLENNPGIIAMGLRVHFDTTKLKLVEAVDAKTMPGGLFSNVLSSPFRMVWEDSLSLTDYKVNGVIATLRFEVLDGSALGETPVSVTYDPDEIYNVDMQNVAFETKAGGINIVDFTYGDVDENGKINLRDVTLLTKYVAEVSGITLNQHAADVTVDGKINLRDVTLLKKYVAEWDGIVLGPQKASSPVAAYSAFAAPALKNSGDAAPTIRVSKAEGKVGETVDVTISLENNPGIIAMGLRVHFDTTKLKLIEAVDAKTMPGGLFSNVLSSPYRMIWEDSLSLTDYKVNGVIATLRFEILAPCAASADTVSITYDEDEIYNVDMNNVYFDVVNGSVTVPSVHTHTWSEWMQTKAPTCTEKGTEARTCSGCGETETRELNALGHDWSEYKETKPATCEEKGEKTKTCKRSGCGAQEKSEIPALGHALGNWVLTTPPTCTANGEETRSCVHTGCTKSETRPVNALGHDWGEWIVTKPATETETGTREHTCKRCLTKEEETIGKLTHTNHVYEDDWTVVREPSCVLEGVEIRYCHFEGCNVSETRAIPALGHDMEHFDRVEPTEESNGNIEYWLCKRCGRYYTDELGTNEISQADTILYATLNSIFSILPTLDDDLPFDDVRSRDWFYDDVLFVYNKGIMNGVAENLFKPYDTLSRAMIVTILYRMAGEPVVSGKTAFKDVKANLWYSDAVEWAAANKIVEGYGNGKFGPDDAVTREQLAAILYRYAQTKGYALAGGLGLNPNGKASAWAKSYVEWAAANDILVDGLSVDATVNADRAEVAAAIRGFFYSLVF